MNEQIINDILSLKSGEEFSLGQYFTKYNLSTSQPQRFKMCFEIIKGLEKEIEPKLKPVGDSVPVTGLPENIIYIRK